MRTSASAVFSSASSPPLPTNGACAGGGAAVGQRPEHPNHLRRGRPHPRLATEEARAQIVEIRRDAGDLFRRARRDVVLLREQDLQPRPFERRAAGQRFEEEHPHRVQVGLGPDARAGHRLLRRHVDRRADDRVPRGAGPIELGHETEVEQHHAAACLDANVARLHVAVNHPRVVQRRETERELAHARTEALFVEAMRDRFSVVGRARSAG